MLLKLLCEKVRGWENLMKNEEEETLREATASFAYLLWEMPICQTNTENI